MTLSYTTNYRFYLPDFRSEPWHSYLQINFQNIDSILSTSFAANNINAWANDFDYIPGNVAIDETDNTFYAARVTHTSAAAGSFAADRAAHPTYWAEVQLGLVGRGEWAHNTQYNKYDFAYDSVRGIVGICNIAHVSNNAGIITDDAANWKFIIDVSNLSAIAFDYDNTTSGLVATNIQAAIDEVDHDLDVAQALLVTHTGQISTLTTNLATEAATRAADDTAESAARISADATLTTNVNLKANKAITVTGGGIATGGGDLTTNQVITVTKSSNAQAIAFADDTTAMTPVRVGDAITARFPAGTRTPLTANATYYVRSDGSDANTGLANSAGGALLTLQKAVDTVALLDIGNFNVTINCSNGSVTGNVTLKDFEGSGSCTIICSGTGVITHTSTSGIACFLADQNKSKWIVGDVSISIIVGAVQPLFHALNQGVLRIQATTIAIATVAITLSNPDSAFFRAQRGGTILLLGFAMTITNTGTPTPTAVFYADNKSMIICSATSSIAMSGAWSNTYYCFYTQGSYIHLLSAQITLGGTAPTAGQRYNGALLGLCNTGGGGASYFPGVTAGAVATSALYV